MKKIDEKIDMYLNDINEAEFKDIPSHPMFREVADKLTVIDNMLDEILFDIKNNFDRLGLEKGDLRRMEKDVYTMGRTATKLRTDFLYLTRKRE